jgi:hypothetical protein
MFRKLAALLCFVCLMAVSASFADEWNKKTVVTFTAPVELPGIVLPPGTYVFKLMDSQSNRNIVQVFNKDETHLFTTILAIPNYRLEPSENTVLRFEERPSNTPEAIRAWFYPGDNFGQEFVYPKGQGSEIAKRTSIPVLTTEAPPTAPPQELVQAPVTAAVPEFLKAPPVLEKPEPAPPIAAAPPTPAIPEPTPNPAFTTLPKTASPLPAMALFGMFSLVLAALLRRAAHSIN